MIGNMADAAQALSDYMQGNDDRLLSADGTTRMVYLINGVVYKIHHVKEQTENVDEFYRIRNHSDILPEGVYYPEVGLFEIDNDNIIAMEYIEGRQVAECFCTPDESCDDSCMPMHVWESVHTVLGDTGGFNVVLNDKGIWIIDAG